MQSLKCKHEWRLFGTRLEEEVSNVSETSGPIVCTKCGLHQHADGYEYIEERPVPEYSGSWAAFAQDIIVKPKVFGTKEETTTGYNSRTKKEYDETKWKWDDKEEQWVKTYPITWKEYFQVLRKMI